MVPLLAALIGLQPAPVPNPATLGRTAWIFSTVGHSEFCPPGNVTVDLRTGRYTLTVRAPRRLCDEVVLERPEKQGTLVGGNLARLRLAFLRVVTEGAEKRPCREPGKQHDIIISNGGTPVLVLVTGRGAGSAPDDLTCWSEASTALHEALNEVFGARDWR